jgi:hypothetical protein
MNKEEKILRDFWATVGEIRALKLEKFTHWAYFEGPVPCRIREHDGAYKCYAHDKMWGAVSKPDTPCAGWNVKGTHEVKG